MRRARCGYCIAQVGVAALPGLILLTLASLAFPFGLVGGFWLCRSAGSLALPVIGGLAGAVLLPLPSGGAPARLVPLVVRERRRPRDAAMPEARHCGAPARGRPRALHCSARMPA